MRNLFVIGVMLLFGRQLSAQQDTVRILGEVQVSATKRTQQIVGTRVDRIDTAVLKQMSGLSLAEVLSQQSGVFIKNYGPGNLASSSLRGGSASHTQLYWGNLNIQNPMLGQNDFSLFPTIFFNNIQLQYGGIGGIYLSNSLQRGTGLEVSLNPLWGSFGNRQLSGGLSFSGSKTITSFKTFFKTAENNYPFLNTYLDTPAKIKLQHAEQEQAGFILEQQCFFNSGMRLGLSAWIQQANRDLPPTMAQSSSAAIQKDHSKRFMAELAKTNERLAWIVSTAFFADRIFYEDEIVTSNSRSNSLIQQVEIRKWWSENQKFLLRGKVNNTYTVAKANGYGSITPSQNRALAQLTLEYRPESQKLFVQLGLKEEYVSRKQNPLCPSVGIEWKPLSWFSVLGNSARIYRLPTFNDQFWVPGGNPDLEAENGYAEEAGIKLSAQTKRWSFEETTTIFNKNINNWIIWLPGTNYWSPQNLMSVWSRGIETKWVASYTAQRLLVSLNLLTNYVVATNQKAKFAGDESLERQLIYTPVYTGQGGLTIAFKSYSLMYNHCYTGYTYTSSDNLSYLKPYQVANLFLSKKIAYKETDLTLGFRCFNVFDVSYQTVAIRPMPGRNFQVSLSFSFHKPLKQQI